MIPGISSGGGSIQGATDSGHMSATQGAYSNSYNSGTQFSATHALIIGVVLAVVVGFAMRKR